MSASISTGRPVPSASVVLGCVVTSLAFRKFRPPFFRCDRSELSVRPSFHVASRPTRLSLSLKSGRASGMDGPAETRENCRFLFCLRLFGRPVFEWPSIVRNRSLCLTLTPIRLIPIDFCLFYFIFQLPSRKGGLEDFVTGHHHPNSGLHSG